LTNDDILDYTFKLNKKWGLDYSQFMLLLNFLHPIARLTGDIHDFVLACVSMKLFFNQNQPGVNQSGRNIHNFLICPSTQAYYNNDLHQIHIVRTSGSLNDIMADARYNINAHVGGKGLQVGGEKKLTASDYESVFFNMDDLLLSFNFLGSTFRSVLTTESTESLMTSSNPLIVQAVALIASSLFESIVYLA
jgi:hypothetical protein